VALKSNKLDFKDLGVVFGIPVSTGTGGAVNAEQKSAKAQYDKSARLIPDAEIDFTRLGAVNADIDFVAAWVRLMINGTFTTPERRYAVGTAYLRGQGTGQVRTVEGLEAVREQFDAIICDARLPYPGQHPTGSYEGEGYIIVRHPDTTVVQHALERIVSTVRVRLG
jgi:hypothetical protein